MSKGILKTLRLLHFNNSWVHAIVVADLPEYSLGAHEYYELDSDNFQDIINGRPIVFVFGRFFRDYRNFQKYADHIRRYFTPMPAIIQNVSKFVEKARQDSDLLVGVHIRRGDYAEFMKGKYFYEQEQFADKMRQLRDNSPEKKIAYIICSNESVNFAFFDGLNFSVGSGQVVEDMYILAQCDLIMGPPSTFSSWAAFYGDRPLYQMKNIEDPVSLRSFVQVPPEVLYNF